MESTASDGGTMTGTATFKAMKPRVPEGPPVPDANAFFDICERVARRTFDPNDIDRPVMAFFDAEGHMRLRRVAGEEEYATLAEGAWQYPVITAVGLMREHEGAIVATYRTRNGDESELRIPIFGAGNTRTLSATATRRVAPPRRLHGTS